MRRRLKLHKRFFLFLLPLLAILLFGCAQYGGQQQVASPTSAQPPSGGKIVEITASGFNPVNLTISAGETVTFINRDSAPHWIASGPHPVHTLYPEPGGCIGSKFDACKALAQGESFSFQFNQKGSWPYHDHLNVKAPFFGRIIVQ